MSKPFFAKLDMIDLPVNIPASQVLDKFKSCSVSLGKKITENSASEIVEDTDLYKCKMLNDYLVFPMARSKKL